MVDIRDPQTSLGAKVSGTGRLHTASRSLTVGEGETLAGRGFNLNPGDITLTTANESGLLYVSNTGPDPLIVDTFIFILGASANGTGTALVQVYKNPTTGTLIASGTALSTAAIARDFGSSQTPTATMLFGAEGSTITASDGVVVSSRSSAPGRLPLSVGSVVVRQGTSVAMTITPPTGNTSMVTQVAMQLYIDAEGQSL